MHEEKTPDGTHILPISRRSFVQGLAVGGAIVALDWCGSPIFGETQHRNSDTLTGTHFDLTMDYLPVNLTGRHRLQLR
jgi:hypothetical protein